MQRSPAALCGQVSFQSGFAVGLASLVKLNPNIGNNARGILEVHKSRSVSRDQHVRLTGRAA
jgi:hypothetical protein